MSKSLSESHITEGTVAAVAARIRRQAGKAGYVIDLIIHNRNWNGDHSLVVVGAVPKDGVLEETTWRVIMQDGLDSATVCEKGHPVLVKLSCMDPGFREGGVSVSRAL